MIIWLEQKGKLGFGFKYQYGHVTARGAPYILQGVWFLRKGPCEYTSGTEETSTTKTAHFTAAANAFARVMKSNLCVLWGLMWQLLPIFSKLLSICFSLICTHTYIHVFSLVLNIHCHTGRFKYIFNNFLKLSWQTISNMHVSLLIFKYELKM